MLKCRQPYRVFISYSHDDTSLANELETHLRANGAVPVRDTSIAGGVRFSDEIRRKISFCHLFVCLLTRNSKVSPWIHQEMAYAMGLGLPVLPLALDELPEGMAQEIQATRVSRRLSDLPGRLTPRNLDNLVASAQIAGRAMFECADKLYDRTRLLVDYARDLKRLEGPCKIRQRAAFGSFSIPDRPPKHEDWRITEGANPRDESLRELLRQERVILEEHAREAGCELIIDPFVLIRGDSVGRTVGLKHPYHPTVRRLEILEEFLASLPDDKLRIVIQQGQIDGSTTILGDWVSAEAVVPHYKSGYRQTIFTRHAPTVLAKIEEFDRDFADAVKDGSQAGVNSNQAMIATLRRRIEELKEGAG